MPVRDKYVITYAWKTLFFIEQVFSISLPNNLPQFGAIQAESLAKLQNYIGAKLESSKVLRLGI